MAETARSGSTGCLNSRTGSSRGCSTGVMENRRDFSVQVVRETPLSSSKSSTVSRRLQPPLFELLQALLHEGEEAPGLGTVNETVIVAQRQVTHRPDPDRVVHPHRPLL